jgi:Holliday junction resolvase RusA-like endonuclease
MPTIDLPLPPSVNRLWRSNRGRVHRSAPYAAWLKEAGWELLQQRPKAVPGCVSIAISAGKPDKRRRDLDNIAGKAVLDLLTKHQVIEDDSKVLELSGRWDDSVAPRRLQVEITPAAAQAGKHESNGQSTMSTTKRPTRAKPTTPDTPETEPPKRKTGRPSKYDPSYCELVRELGRQGKSKAQIAAEIGVNRSTIDEWGKAHKPFADALKDAYDLALAWWEDTGQVGMTRHGFNATTFIFQMKNRFREEYRDVQTIDSTIRRPGDTTGISDAELENLIREIRGTREANQRTPAPTASTAKPDSVH